MRRFLLVCFTLVMAGSMAIAQSSVTGKVVDASGTPIEGAAVVVKGTTIGAFTNSEGSFKLEVPAGATSLVVSYVGMGTQDVAVSGSNMTITLKDSDFALEEVVVTALGITRQKKALGYSVQEVNSDQILQSQEANIATALSGKVAGVQAFSTSGAPGAAANIRIRGSASISGDNQPLFVVDGIPISNAQERTQSGLAGAAVSNRALDINPNDIASMTVLKGAAAAALYGSRAADGVILITTKKGSNASGKLDVQVRSTFTVSEVNRLPEFQKEFAQGLNGISSGNIRTWGAPISETVVDPVTSIPVPAGTAGAVPAQVYDNYEDFWQRGNRLDNYVSLSGGNADANFYASIGDLRETGIIPGSEFNRTTVGLRGGTKVGEKLRVSGSVNLTRSQSRRAQQGSNGGGVGLALYRAPASYNLDNGVTEYDDPASYLNPNGTQRNWTGSFNNPYWTVNQDPFTDDINRVFGNLEWEYKPLPWLSIMQRLGNDFYLDRRKQIFAIGSANGGRVGQVIEDQFNRRETYSDFFVTATKDLGPINASLMVGNNLSHRYSQNFFTQGTNLSVENFYNLGNASDIVSSESHNIFRTAALFFSTQFSYDDWAFLDVTGRNEWASTFGPAAEQQSFFYPSVNASVIFTEALGMSGSSAFPFGKLRLSYAEVGSQPPVYSTATLFTQPSITDGYTRNNGVQGPFLGRTLYGQSTTLGNAFLSPERVKSFEVGVDLRFFDNRLGLDLTYYDQTSVDQIFSVPVAASSGYLSTILNAGTVTSKGFEVVVTATPVKSGSFTWDIIGNFSLNRNIVVELAEGVENIGLGGFFGANGRLVAGQPFGQLYGDLFFRDDNGNMVIESDPTSPEYGFPLTDFEEGVVGDPNPDWLAGLRNTFSYKGFSLSAFMDVKMGGDLWNGTRGALVSYGTAGETAGRGVETRVFEGVKGTRNGDNVIVPTGETNDIEALLDEGWYRAGNGSGFNGPSEQYIEDASWVRLRDVTLSYALPQALLASTPFGRLEVSVAGRNLWLMTDYRGIDPETNLSGAGNLQGLDYFQMPNTRSLTFAVNLAF